MPALRRLQHLIAFKERHPHPGDVILGILAAACLAGGPILFALPADRASGPALATLYALPRWVGLPGQQTWAVVWTLLGVAPLAAVLRPSVTTRRWAWVVLLTAGCAWTAGLAWPLLFGPAGNAWAVGSWAVGTAVGYVLAGWVPFDAPFYRPVRTRRRAEG